MKYAGHKDSMAQEVFNFGWFYGLFEKLPGLKDAEAVKKEMVKSFTWGRTDSLKEMKKEEYDNLCKSLEKLVGPTDRERMIKAIKQKRSMVLHQMQLYGVDTANWDRVNEFCRNPRITGKEFRELSGDELDALQKKLRAMRRKKEE